MSQLNVFSDENSPKVFIISDIDEVRQNILTNVFCKFLEKHYRHPIRSNLTCTKGNHLDYELIENETTTATRLVLINSKSAFDKYNEMMRSSNEISDDLFTYSVRCLRNNMRNRPNAFEDLALIQFSCTPDEFLIRELQTNGVCKFKLMDEIEPFLHFLHDSEISYKPSKSLLKDEYLNTREGCELRNAIVTLDSGFEDNNSLLVEQVVKDTFIEPSDTLSDEITSLNIIQGLSSFNQ